MKYVLTLDVAKGENMIILDSNYGEVLIEPFEFKHNELNINHTSKHKNKHYDTPNRCLSNNRIELYYILLALTFFYISSRLIGSTNFPMVRLRKLSTTFVSLNCFLMTIHLFLF